LPELVIQKILVEYQVDQSISEKAHMLADSTGACAKKAAGTPIPQSADGELKQGSGLLDGEDWRELFGPNWVRKRGGDFLPAEL
jgi:hypothetical protein